MAVNQSCLAMQKDGAIREMENRMTQAAKQNTLHQQLLQVCLHCHLFIILRMGQNGTKWDQKGPNGTK